MTPRWFAILLSLFLAVPLCCCGWHEARADDPTTVCPMCVAADTGEADGDDSGCLCARELVQREVPPKTFSLEGPGSVFASLAETMLGVLPRAKMWHEPKSRFHVVVRHTGPPRWYLRHQAWLC